MDVKLTDAQYEQLIDTLAQVGILSPGIQNQFRHRRQTHLRQPWVRKGEPYVKPEMIS